MTSNRNLTLLASVAALALLAREVAAAPESWERRDLHSFGQRDPQGGRSPEDPPILGMDGALYGTTQVGGAFFRGVVYRFQPNDSSYRVLRHFVGGADGGSPMGSAFLQADDGRLYGLAVNPRLILYSLATDGSDYRIVFTFPPGAEEGGTFATVNSLTKGPDGLLYGIYVTGGPGSPPSQGTIFRLGYDGSGFQILATITRPSSPVSFGVGGQVFGTTESTVYRLSPNGSGFATLINFPPPSFGTTQAEGKLLRASDGFLYGQTNRGGTHQFGTYFRLREDGSDFAILFEPTIVTEAGHFRAPSFESGDGFIYGAAGEDGFGTESFVWRMRPNGTGWQVLKRLSFNGRGTNGVVEAPDGFFYGFTTGGPGGNELFRMARDGSSFAIVHDFLESEGFPLTPITLVRGTDQRFYGLTDKDGTSGSGTFFRVNADGSGLTIVRDFGIGPAPEQAKVPKALCAGPDGALYGIVRQQGSAGAGIFRFQPTSGSFVWIQTFTAGLTADSTTLLVGSDKMLYGAIDTSSAKTERIFRLTTNGAGFTVLRTLTSSAPSFLGTAALTEGPDGLLYGVTTRNGSNTLPLLFRISKDGFVFNPLHDINVGTNPATNPPRGLLAAPDGRLYGYSGNILFRSEPDGTGFQALHTFPATTYSQQPIAGFDGNIYGVLRFGGSAGRGAIFRLAPNGSGYEEVFSFPLETLSGQFPLGFLITAPDGAFCGLTEGGGESNHGTLFRVSTPAQIVGIAGGSLGFDKQGRSRGSVVGPPARPVDVWQSDDLQSWSLLQRVPAPDVNSTFLDPSVPRPSTRFFRATAP